MINVIMKQGRKPIAHAHPVTLASAPSSNIKMNAGIAQSAAKIKPVSTNRPAVTNSSNI